MKSYANELRIPHLESYLSIW